MTESMTAGRPGPCAGRPTPLHLVDREGVAWAVWDVVDGQRETPGVFATGERLFVRVADHAAFACPLDPLVRRALETDPATLASQLGRALAVGPLRRPGEPAGAFPGRAAEDPAAGAPARDGPRDRTGDRTGDRRRGAARPSTRSGPLRRR
jgi:hypothetical protein